MKTSEQKSPVSEEQESPAFKRKPKFSKPYAAIALAAVLAALVTAGGFLVYPGLGLDEPGNGAGASGDEPAAAPPAAGETTPVPDGGAINIGE